MGRKSNHKHDYELCIQQCEPNTDRYRLINVCRLCGYRRDPPFKQHLDKRPDGSYFWLIRKADFIEKYGDIREVD